MKNKTAGIISAAIVATAIGVAVVRNEVPPPALTAVVWAFPQADHPDERLNVLVNANAIVPDAVWQSAAWRDAIRCDGHTFPVHLWVRKSGEWSRATTVRLPCDRGGYQIVPVTPLGGDMVGVEDTPAIMVREGVLPLGSLIENSTNDPVTLAPWRVEVRQ